MLFYIFIFCIMRKILSMVLFVFLLFWGFNYVNASNQSKVTKIMNNFYSKLDKSISNIEKKINKLEVVSNKIESIKKVKWNKLSNNSKELINLIESNINSKIIFYKKELENQKEEIDISDLLWDDEVDNYQENNNDSYENHEDHYQNISKWWLYLSLSNDIITNKDFDTSTNDSDIDIYKWQWKDVADIDLHWKNEDIQVKTIKITFNKDIKTFSKWFSPSLNIYEWEWKSGSNYLWSPSYYNDWNIVYYNYNNLTLKKWVDYKMYISASYDWVEIKWVKVEKVEITSAKWLKSWKEVRVDMNDIWLNNRLRLFNLYK